MSYRYYLRCFRGLLKRFTFGFIAKVASEHVIPPSHHQSSLSRKLTGFQTTFDHMWVFLFSCLLFDCSYDQTLWVVSALFCSEFCVDSPGKLDLFLLLVYCDALDCFQDLHIWFDIFHLGLWLWTFLMQLSGMFDSDWSVAVLRGYSFVWICIFDSCELHTCHGWIADY